MEQYFITFRSVTYGQKGERALKSEKLSCSLMRAPKWMETRGCGYAVQVENFQKAVQLLKEKNIPFEKAYRVQGNMRKELQIP